MGTTSMPVLGDFTQLSFYEEAVELFDHSGIFLCVCMYMVPYQ